MCYPLYLLLWFCCSYCHLLHLLVFFFFNDTATTEIYTLSLHDALPIYLCPITQLIARESDSWRSASTSSARGRSEEHTSELQSRQYLVCRLLLEKKKTLLPTFDSQLEYLPHGPSDLTQTDRAPLLYVYM